MNKREAKAVELLRICQQAAYNYSLKIDSDYSKLGDPNPSDEVLIKMYYPEYEAIFEAMAWQAEESKLNYIEHIAHLLQTGPLQFADEKVINAILTAGMEEE